MSITLKRNKYLKIKPLEMACDIELKPAPKPPLPASSFFMVVSGAPSSGKTTCVLNLLRSKNAYKCRFELVFWFSPSSHTAPLQGIPKENIYTEYTDEQLEELIEEIKEEYRGMSVLFVFDDLVNSLKPSPILLKLIMNRRHILGDEEEQGHPASIMIITQKYNKLHLSLRSQLSHCILFQPMTNEETETVQKSLFNLDKEDMELIFDTAFGEENEKNFIFIDAGKRKKGRYFINFDEVLFD